MTPDPYPFIIMQIHISMLPFLISIRFYIVYEIKEPSGCVKTQGTKDKAYEAANEGAYM